MRIETRKTGIIRRRFVTTIADVHNGLQIEVTTTSPSQEKSVTDAFKVLASAHKL